MEGILHPDDGRAKESSQISVIGLLHPAELMNAFPLAYPTEERFAAKASAAATIVGAQLLGRLWIPR